MEQIIESLTHIDKLLTISFWFFAICILICFVAPVIKSIAALIYDFHIKRKQKKERRLENEQRKSQTES